MPSLREWQQLFISELLQDSPTAARLPVSGMNYPVSALDIYRHNRFLNQSQAVLGSYPALVRLLGENCSQALAQRYLQCYPSCSGDLNQLHVHLPAFLPQLSELADWPYLADVAKLELAIWQVATAADRPWSLSLAEEEILEDELAQWAVTIDPAIQLLDSAYPVVAIWRAQIDDELFDMDSAAPLAETALVYRQQGRVVVDSLSRVMAAFLRALQQGQSLAQASGQLSAMDGDWMACLCQLARYGVMQKITREHGS